MKIIHWSLWFLLVGFTLTTCIFAALVIREPALPNWFKVAVVGGLAFCGTELMAAVVLVPWKNHDERRQ